MRKLFLILFVAAAISSCAQPKLIRKEYAYFQVQTPGMATGDQNQPEGKNLADTLTIIFVEVKDSSITWERAWKGGSSFTISAIEIKNYPLAIGNTVTNERITIHPAEGNKLFLLELRKDPVAVQSPVSLDKGTVLLTGKSGSKQWTHSISHFTELTTPRHQ